MNTVSRWKRASLALLGGLALVGVLGAPAGADGPATNEPPPVPGGTGDVIPESGSSVVNSNIPEAQGLTIKVEKDTQPRPSIFQDNYAPLIVTILKDGQPTTVDYEVFAIGRHRDGGNIETSDTYTCLERSYTSPTTPRGVFWCTVITDHGGDWTFTAYVNKFRQDPKVEVPVNLGQASVTTAVTGGQLENAGKPRNTVSGEGFEVAILALHAMFGGGWFAAIGVLVLLSLAGGRRLLSARGTHIIEAKLDRIITFAKAFTICVTGTGIYMLFRMTAYDTPSSPDKLDQVFDLPYGRPYFLSLFGKIAIYAVLVAFSFVLIRESKRRSTQLIEPGRRRKPEREVDPTDIWSKPWESDKPRSAPAKATTTMVEEQVTVETEPAAEAGQEVVVEPTKRGIKVATYATVAGGGAIMLCVTLLKYFHELIEATRTVVGS